MIKFMYTTTTKCAVIDGSRISDWFFVNLGVKQGCNISWFLFIRVTDWTMNNFTSKLDDLNFADITLLPRSKEQRQHKYKKLTISRFIQTGALGVFSAEKPTFGQTDLQIGSYVFRFGTKTIVVTT